MVGETHTERSEYAIKYFEAQGFNIISITNLETKLKELTNRSERVRPDVIMIKHSEQSVDITKRSIPIPMQIDILWIEVFDTNFQGFPRKNDVVKAMYYTLTWKDIYDSERLRKSIYGQKIKTEQLLYEFFKSNPTRICVYFYLVQDDSIWECNEIDKEPLAFGDI